MSYKHYPDLIEMAKAVDTLIVIVPGGAATAKMINADVLKALGPRGVLINVARGSVVDEPALIAALKSGTILAAGLDVFANEPNVPDELKAMQNVVLLPHIGSASVVTRNAMDQLVVDNLKTWFAGKAPLTPVAETPVKGSLMSGQSPGHRVRSAVGAVDRRRIAGAVAGCLDPEEGHDRPVGARHHRAQQDLRRHAERRYDAAGPQARARARLRGGAAVHQGYHRLEHQGPRRYRAAAGCRRRSR